MNSCVSASGLLAGEVNLCIMKGYISHSNQVISIYIVFYTIVILVWKYKRGFISHLPQQLCSRLAKHGLSQMRMLGRSLFYRRYLRKIADIE